MTGICCGVVGESEPAVQVKRSSRASRRRRMQLRAPFKFVADVAVVPPLDNDSRKRQRIDLRPLSPPPRDCENAAEKCEESSEPKHIDKEYQLQPTKDQFIDSSQSLILTGNSSSKPVVDVEDNNDEAVQDRPKFGMSAVCGRRRDMEDAVSMHPSFCRQNFEGVHFFGVFDGHGCSHVAMKCRDRLHQIVREEVEGCCEQSAVEWKETMERSYDRMDKEVNESSAEAAASFTTCRCDLQTTQRETVGSTAVVSIVTPDKIVVSNCGDSRAVLCRNGVSIPLSIDQKPNRPDEMQRIEEAGGRVIYWDGHRVLGVLAMSRAIGDNYLKPYVISEPEVTITDRTEEDECLILASDGLWDVMSNDTACRVARMCLRAQKRLSNALPGSDLVTVCGERAATESSDKACSYASILLTKLALARHSTDNVSVVVVDLRRNQQI